MKALVVLSLFLLSLLLAQLLPRLRVVLSPLRRPAILLGTLAPYMAAGLVLAFLAGRAGLLSETPFPRIAEALDVYRYMLCEIPRTVQSFLGLALLLPAGVVTLHAVRRAFPEPATAVLAGATVVFALAYQFLPFHLSAPDFDDVFLLAKMQCAIQSDWYNNKPFFTVYDFAYRAADLLPGTGDRTLPFAVNGWLWVLFQADLLLLLRRFVPCLREPGPGRAAARIGVVLALGNLGALTVAHTVHYELASTVLMLTSFLFVESIVSGAGSLTGRRAALLTFCSVSTLMVPLTSNQMSALWVLSLGHGVLGLSRIQGLRTGLIAASLLVVAAVACFFSSNAVGVPFQAGRWDLPSAGILVGIVLAGAWAVLHFIRSGGAGRLVSGLDRDEYRRAVLVAYFVATALSFAVPNQGHAGLPVTFTLHWPLATNHARYSLPFYPFLVIAIGWGVGRLRARPAAALAAVVVAALAWNFSYVFGFYASLPAWGDGRPAFQRNMRPLRELAARIEAGATGPFYYLPIGRDHGDHFLLAAARPDMRAQNLCQAAPGDPPDQGLVIVSRNTLIVGSQIRTYRTGVEDPEPPQPFTKPLPDPDAPGWELELLDVRGMAPEALSEWCAVEARLGPDQFRKR